MTYIYIYTANWTFGKLAWELMCLWCAWNRIGESLAYLHRASAIYIHSIYTETLIATKNCCFTESHSLTRAHKNRCTLVSTCRIGVKFAAIGTTKIKTAKSLGETKKIFLPFGCFLRSGSHMVWEK